MGKTDMGPYEWKKIVRSGLDDFDVRVRQQRRHAMVIGLPGSGKSCYLDQYKRKLGDQAVVISVEVSDIDQFMRQFVDSARSALAQAGIEITAIRDENSPVDELKNVLKEACQCVKKCLVVVVRSFEQIRKLSDISRAQVGNNLFDVFNGAFHSDVNLVLVLESDRDLKYVMRGAQKCKTKLWSMIGNREFVLPFNREQTAKILEANGWNDRSVAEWFYTRLGGVPQLVKFCYDQAWGKNGSRTCLQMLSENSEVSRFQREWVERTSRLLSDIKDAKGSLWDSYVAYIRRRSVLSGDAMRILKSECGLILDDGSVPLIVKDYVCGEGVALSGVGHLQKTPTDHEIKTDEVASKGDEDGVDSYYELYELPPSTVRQYPGNEWRHVGRFVIRNDWSEIRLFHDKQQKLYTDILSPRSSQGRKGRSQSDNERGIALLSYFLWRYHEYSQGRMKQGEYYKKAPTEAKGVTGQKKSDWRKYIQSSKGLREFYRDQMQKTQGQHGRPCWGILPDEEWIHGLQGQ